LEKTFITFYLTKHIYNGMWIPNDLPPEQTVESYSPALFVKVLISFGGSRNWEGSHQEVDPFLHPLEYKVDSSARSKFWWNLNSGPHTCYTGAL
jgi:hypothetical protein